MRPRLKEDSAAPSKVRFGSLEIIIYTGQYFVRRPRSKEDSAALSKLHVCMYVCIYVRIYIYSADQKFMHIRMDIRIYTFRSVRSGRFGSLKIIIYTGHYFIMCICMYVYVCMRMYVSKVRRARARAHTHTHTHTHCTFTIQPQHGMRICIECGMYRMCFLSLEVLYIDGCKDRWIDG